MTHSNHYPATVAEVLTPSRKFKPAVLLAVRDFAHSRPWRGTIDERRDKFRKLHLALAAAYHRPPARLIFAGQEDEDSGRSCYIPALNTIILRGRLSVITFLHEVKHGVDWMIEGGPAEFEEREAVGWSVTLFQRAFPKSFARLKFDGHMCRTMVTLPRRGLSSNSRQFTPGNCRK